ncbi:hypothetical protein BGW36DRAFT_466682 [Talaromyces proteolyticus]|uniref:Transmembrane protein n=1 Tax=Talaromyces proteolyticus TaxID=1131652 RepID=A0AAD4PUB3_9EURO|nr:uncharacterized protein BGW36DRAFT_466682 [Talaromyces proteolyticus]KAH8689135.1 hypothetical protein BGW36DRAFT_466682 [Talaromyces proteolyticus]
MANLTSAPATTTTAPPDPRLVAERLDFWARQAFEPTTCGYVNGDTGSPVTCSFGISCLSFTSANVHYCGILAYALPPTACIDSTYYVTACDRTCQEDYSTLKCTLSTNIHCVTMYWNDPIGTNPPMSGFTCSTTNAILSVTSAADLGGPLPTAASTGAVEFTYGNGASIASSTPASTTGEASSSSSGLTHDDIIYIVVAIVGFLIVVGLVAVAIRKWKKPAPRQDNVYDDRYRYPPATTTHVSQNNWPTYHTPTTTSGFLGTRSEITPDDSVSQVQVPATHPPTYTQLYSHAPTGSAGL